MERSKDSLSPRQIINRYKKGAYTDECADAISAAVSASDLDFDSIAIPIQKCWIEDVLENIALCFQLFSDRDKADSILANITDERVRSVLLDLSLPELWKAITGDGDYLEAIIQHNLFNKYSLDHSASIIDFVTFSEWDRIKSLGIDMANLSLALRFMFKDSAR